MDVAEVSHKVHTNCRVCGSSDMVKYLDLGMMPLPNNLYITNTQAVLAPRFPLEVLFCNECSLSQLSVVVSPETMFSYYTYRSSINKGYVIHCNKMAIDLQNKYSLNEDSFVIDIAGNDGALLKEFKAVIDCTVLNIDPAKNLCKIAIENGVDSINDFWSIELSNNIKETKKEAAIIIATNVFAHVDNVFDFIAASKILLKENGVLVLEFPYIIDFIEGFEMDTVYFEHLSYFSIAPLLRLSDRAGMRIIEVEKFDIHGGTVRVTIASNESTLLEHPSVKKFIDYELLNGYNTIDIYNNWAKKSHEIIKSFRVNVLKLKGEGANVWAFAASAKGNTLLNCAKINNEIINYIIDETPEKNFQYSPGTGIMIKGMHMIEAHQPDYIIILSWNFAEEIMKKLNKIYKGKYIIPIPDFNIIDSF